MTNEMNEVIAMAVARAYAAGLREGERLERDCIRRALDLNASGGKIYLDDFEDALRELDAERQEKKLP